MNGQNYAGARDELAKAFALNTNLGEAHVLYARASMLTGDSDLTATEFKAELAVHPFRYDANLELRTTFREAQNYEQAPQYFGRALETLPSDPGVRYQLALIALGEGKPEEAQQLLEALVRESPAVTKAHASLSLIYYRLNRPEDGKREREIVQRLAAEAQAKQPDVKPQ